MVSLLLTGLGFKYDSFVTSMTISVESMPFEDLYDHLLTHELCLTHSQISVDLTTASATISFKGQLLEALEDLAPSIHPQIVVNVMVPNITVEGDMVVVPFFPLHLI